MTKIDVEKKKNPRTQFKEIGFEIQMSSELTDFFYLPWVQGSKVLSRGVEFPNARTAEGRFL